MSLLDDLHSINRDEQRLKETVMIRDTAINGFMRKKQKRLNERRVKKHIERMDRKLHKKRK